MTETTAPPARTTARPRRSRSGRVQAVAVVAGVAGACAAVLWRDPHVTGNLGVCPLHAVTGLYCPGCGTLRALYDLLHGDMAGALGHNVLTVPVLAVLVAWAIWTLVPRARADTASDRHPPLSNSAGGAVRSRGRQWVPLAISSAVLVIFVVFTVARNLPGSPLAP